MGIRDTLFDDIDSMDPERFAAHLADGVEFRFGNGEPVQGRDAVRDVWAGFCENIDGVSHSMRAQWDTGEAVIAEAEVTYTRKDGSTVSLPVVTIYRPAGPPISDYRIFMDVAPLFGDG